MIYTQKEFADYGTTKIADNDVLWSYYHIVKITIHEETETFSCKLLGKETMCLRDLKKKCRRIFRAQAISASRRKYVEEMDAKQRAQELANAVHVDLNPKSAHEAFG